MASGELHNLLQELLPVTVYVVVVSTVFVLVLGLPIFLVLKHLNKLSWRWLIAFGFSAAAIPLALVTFPLWPSPANVSSGANWHGHYVDFVKNGIYTIYGWLNYVENVLWFGVHGVVGSAVFYYVWLKIVRPNPALKRTANAAA
ncbi:MAG: hypothetical protein JWR16_2841 [Nevskia sp.]|nr:hypothetical protein [Nevskia sp.]